MLFNRTDQKRVLTRDLVNPEPKGGKHPSLLNRMVIPKGTTIMVSEWDPDADMVKRVYSQNLADLTLAQLACLREGEIGIHPDTNIVVGALGIVGKAERLYTLLIEASEPVEKDMVDWAFEHYHSITSFPIIRLLGKVLQAATSLDSNLPLLLGIDQNIDDLVKGLLSKPKDTPSRKEGNI